MRRIVILALSLFCASSVAEFKGRILTYKQLMQLPVTKRANYIREVRKLVLELENQQLAKEKKFSQSKFAWLESMEDFTNQLRIVPEVHATLTDGKDRKEPIFKMPSRPRSSRLGLGWSTPSSTEQTQPETIAPTEKGDPLKEPITRGLEEEPSPQSSIPHEEPGPVEPRIAEPPAGNTRGFVLPPVESEPPEVTSEEITPPPPVGKTASAEVGAVETQRLCVIPEKLECEGLSAKDRDEGIRRFRNEDKIATCFSGGNFSEYPGGRKVPGGCAIVTSWAGKTCPGGQALCNPVTFGAIKYGADKKPVNFQLVCVPKVSRGQYDITNRCSQCPMKEGWERIQNPEDFITLAKLKDKDGKMGAEFIKSWNDLRKALAKNFNDRCLQSHSTFFRAAFCQECKTLGHRIAAMNRSVLKSACAGNYDEIEGIVTDKPGILRNGESPDAKK